jgi:SSS family solute:Na+ symporter
VAVLTSALIVLVYTYAGGLRGAIYNEVLQFFLICAGFAPLVFLGLKAAGGWEGVKASLDASYVHVWDGFESPGSNRMGVDAFGLVMGLGFVASFGYWCTDFLIVQRAMAAESMSAARRTPLIAAVPKMLFPFLVILPGVVAIALTSTAAQHGSVAVPHSTATVAAPADPPDAIIPVKLDAQGRVAVDANGKPVLDYDMVIPNMLIRFFPPGLLGLGMTALLASFMSGMAGNVTAFNTVWTYDIYQAYLRKGQSDRHYLGVGHLATFFGIAASVAAAYTASAFNNIMDLLQLVFAFVNAPVFATFLLGMFWKRATGHGAFAGLLAGTLAAMLHHGLTLPDGSIPGIKGGWISVLHIYPSEMAQNFWTSICSFSTSFVVTVAVSLATRAPDPDRLVGLVRSLTPAPKEDVGPWWKRPAVMGVLVLAAVTVLNIIFR